MIGPDEYHETIDDNAYTNVMARWNIRVHRHSGVVARALARVLGTIIRPHRPGGNRAASVVGCRGIDGDRPRRTDGFVRAIRRLFRARIHRLASYSGRSVPMDVVLGRERTKGGQIVKQADVVALLALLPEEFAGDTGAANFDYYEPRCSHGSSLSRAMHGVAAARLGRSELALRFFRQTSAIDLADTHAAIDGGVHIAALGGVWMMAVLGFAGLSTSDGGIGLDPQLPDGWRSMEFAAQRRGRHLKIRIDGIGRIIEATLETGDPIVVVDGAPHRLRQRETLVISVRMARSGLGVVPTAA